MPEVERKFRIRELPARASGGAAHHIRQGYVLSGATELRIRATDETYTVTVKTSGDISREEWEETIPKWVFDSLWPTTEGKRVKKTRYVVSEGGNVLEFDKYEGQLSPLIILECEFESESEAATFEPPSWVGECHDVTSDSRYKNKRLALLASLADMNAPW